MPGRPGVRPRVQSVPASLGPPPPPAGAPPRGAVDSAADRQLPRPPATRVPVAPAPGGPGMSAAGGPPPVPAPGRLGAPPLGAA
eukprot:1291486-Alexandrium_andersonii.AAC.1